MSSDPELTPRPDADIPLQGLTSDGWSNQKEATSTCLCGAVQMIVPLTAPGLVNTFVCNCSDCRKISASMFATNLTTLDTHTRFTRGESNLTSFSQSKTILAGNSMTNAFCKTCGTIMYRVGSGQPGMRYMRMGTVDDHHLAETVLKPQLEMFVEHRVGWWTGLEKAGAQQVKGMIGFTKQD